MIAPVNKLVWGDSYFLLSNRILTVLNSDIELKDIMYEVIKLIQETTKFSAVAFRLKKGIDFPYFVENGFTDKFIRAENSLISVDKLGNMCIDKTGNPNLECTCGLVITGNVDYSMAEFTKNGSFWTNHSEPLLDLTPEEDPRYKPRNTCIHYGYQSIAIIPIKTHSKIIGTLQLNDKERNSFSLEMIEYFENICMSVGNTLLRKQTELLIEEKNEQLNKLNKQKDKFISIISHDLKSPLNSILGICDILMETVEEKIWEDAKECTVKIKESANNARKLIKDLTEWSQSQTGGTTFKPAEIDLISILNDVCNFYQPIAELKTILIIKELPYSLVIVADKVMVSTVLRNLISNAIKFTPINGTIRVVATQSNLGVKVEIKDNGVGIPPEGLEKLFKLDCVYTTTGTNNERGTGLGLMLCKEFVEKHGGNIWVESKVGAGSNFIFTIPHIALGN